MDSFSLKQGVLEILKVEDSEKNTLDAATLRNEETSKPILRIKKSNFELLEKKEFYSSPIAPILKK